MSKLDDILAQKRARQLEETEKRRHEDFSQFDDLVPDIPYADAEVKKALLAIPLLDAYRRWFPSNEVMGDNSGGKNWTRVQCPLHKDEKPSAAINVKTNLFTCYHDFTGGTILDLAKVAYNKPSVKGSDYFDLCELILREFTTTAVAKNLMGKRVVEPVLITKDEPEDDDEEDNVTDLPFSFIPDINFDEIIPKGDNYLRCWFEEVTKDFVSPYFYFFNGLIPLAMALGRNYRLKGNPPVHTNINICLVGRSASGKSRSQAPMLTVLYRSDIAWEHIQGSNSGEDLVDAFVKEERDSTGKIVGYAPVRGLVDYNELSEYSTVSKRSGSKLESVMISLYDTHLERPLATRSRAGKSSAKNYFGCMVTTTQDKSIRHLLTGEQSNAGALNRIVFVSAPPVKRKALSDVTFELDHTVNLLNDINTWAREEFAPFGEVTKEVLWEDDAKQRLTEFLEAVVFPKQDEDTADFLNRVDLLLVKLALLFSANLKRFTIQLDCVEAAIGLFDYIVYSYGVPEAQIRYTEENEIGDQIIDFLKKWPDTAKGKKVGRPATWSEIRTGVDKKKLIPDSQFRKILTGLADDGRIKKTPWRNEGRGRPIKEGVVYELTA